LVLNVDHRAECELSALKYLGVVGGLGCGFGVRVVGRVLLSGLPTHPHHRAAYLVPSTGPSIVEALDENFERALQTVVRFREVNVREGGLYRLLHDDTRPLHLGVLEAAHIGGSHHIFVDAFEALDFGEDF